MAEFLKELSQQQLAPGEKAKKCKVWLSENPGNPLADVVKMVMDEADVRRNQADVIDSRSLSSVTQEFPYLRDCTYSNPYYPDNHCHADVHPRDVSKAISSVAKPLMDSKFWSSPFVQKSVNCDSESAAQHLVVELLMAVLEGLGLSNHVEISQNRTLAGAECDVLLVYKRNRLPFAVLEVKKPGNSVEGRRLIFVGEPIGKKVGKDKKEVETGGNRVAGEVFAEMKAIQLFGFPTVIGMITTGNQWRIVGLLDDDDQLAESGTEGADVIEKRKTLEAYKGKLAQFLSKQQQTNDGEMVGSGVPATASSPDERSVNFVEGDEEEEKEAKREIWAGEIVPSHEGMNTEQLYEEVKKSGEEIVAQLVLFVVAACSHLSDFLEEGNRDLLNGDEPIKIYKKMACRILTNKKTENERSKHDVFAFGTVKLKNLNLESFNAGLKNIHVIHHIGLGDYGNVCLGTSSDGSSCCAIKFYHDKSRREDFAKEECENWKEVYGQVSRFPKPFALKVAGGHCLVMPYLHPIPKKDRPQLLADGIVSRALTTFANSGYTHRDIKWCHFRRWKKDDQENDRVFLIDLGAGSLFDLEYLENEAAREEHIGTWIKKSIKYLSDSAGVEDSLVRTPRPPSKKLKLESSQDK